MSEDTGLPEVAENAPAEDTAAPDVDAARELLVSQGLHVLDSKNFTGLK